MNLSGELNEVTIQAIRTLRSHGIDLSDIEKIISETAGISQTKLAELLDDVVERNRAYYMGLITLADITAPEVLVSPADVDAIRKQTRDEVRNITRSTGFLVDNGRTKLEPAKAYQWALDRAETKIQAGAVSYNAAIEDAIRELADSGLKIVSYESGRTESVDVAVRRAVMTGINQLNQKYRERSMDYLETDLVEVTAHIGARNTGIGPANHESWQGKVYRWSEKSREIQTRAAGNSQASGLPGQEEITKSAESPASGSQEVREQQRATLEEVTQEYLDSATPGQGTVTYDEGYEIEDHQNEISTANWLKDTFGGDVRLLKEVNEQHVKTADYLWNGKMWDLKSATTEKAANSAIRKGLQQIRENPGGLILNYGNLAVNWATLTGVMRKRMKWHMSERSVDIMVISNGEVRIFRQ